MHRNIGKRNLRGWVAGIVLVAGGFAAGLIVSAGGGAGDQSSTLTTALTPARAVAAPPSGTMNSYADVAAAVMPAVVNISTDKVVESDWQHPFMDDPFFRRFFGDPDSRQNRERMTHSLGSGIIISADGYILTNNHVVEQATKINVSFASEEEFEAELVGADPQTDIALIKVKTDETLPFVRFGDSTTLRPGDQVMAIGNPFGLGQTVTMGIVSAIGRSIGLIDYEDLIQTDATINPGNSGGALVNMNGEVVGMNTAILSRSGGSQGIGFAIPSAMAQNITGMLREDGKVVRAWLGITIADVDQTMARAMGLDKPVGVLVQNVTDDAPAQKAGIEEGDVILQLDGKSTNTMASLRNTVSLTPPGTEVSLRILRDGKEKTVKVKLAEMPPADQLASNSPRLEESEDGIAGVTVRELSSRTRRMANVPDDVGGLIVVNVDPLSNAAQAGLEEGDVIMEIAKEECASIDDYRRLVKQDDDRPILMRVYKQRGGRIFMAIPR